MAIEYPEGVTIAGQMRPLLLDRVIVKTVIRDVSSAVFRWGFSNLEKVDLSGQRIRVAKTFGDYIMLEMDQHVLTFGDMIGRILYHPAEAKRPPKAAIALELDDGAAFTYNPTLYGYCKAFTPEEIANFFQPTWVQPLDDAFTPEYLAQAFAEPERKIAKQMNVYNVKYKAAGVGNGYWQEILYLCGVHPQRKAREITPAEIERLHAVTRRVMAVALEQRGSSDEVDFFGAPGNYTRAMSGRLKGQPCPVCGTAVVGKNILGANVYFCPGCQK